ncbi:N-acetylglucosamine-6-phosphate deacetylase [Alienimonas californiensis]|uniref:N-acetylglucosamine-6-phosphate deacetylase n=1 Tax=Alienimonas californiensis TaxID=2527989 RepID=A0A517PC06_9PLAN|nr:N-acetylglucosamine-6-phosphate deacetylase [Alienimonas californiensis]QDT16914.1 N-acetylglucosamine-6-phosphate deacetylase [Alienimonas californiensis]
MSGPHNPPAFFDLQVNGYAGVDFNRDGLTADDLHAACARIAVDGVAGFLPTVITDDLDAMGRRLRRLAELREQDELARRLIVGLHVEGPFLNETAGYIGAHPIAHARPADAEAMHRLLEAGGGLVRLVTLAPERDPGFAVTRLLADAGVTVAAGHCDPSRDELAAACDAGLTLFTHLGNGCPASLPRHDNVIHRALSLRDRLRFTLIADGVHLPFWFLRDVIALAGLDRCAVVSDAVTAAGLGPGRFTLGAWELEVGEDLACRAPGGEHLVGSACPLSIAFERLQSACGFTRTEATSLTSAHPRAFLGDAT